MSALTMEKPTFTKEQLVSAATASKKFGDLRKRAQNCPLFITDNGNVDTVVIGYDVYEKMFQRLIELEEKEEARLLVERMEQLDKDPSIAIPWKTVRRTGKVNG